MRYQSTLSEKFGRNAGVSVKPMLMVSASSGFRAGLPPVSVEHWLETHCGMMLVVRPLPYCAAVTPVRWH